MEQIHIELETLRDSLPSNRGTGQLGHELKGSIAAGNHVIVKMPDGTTRTFQDPQDWTDWYGRLANV